MKISEQKLNLPAGFRFHPTDEELVVHYLCRKCAGQQIGVPIIAEIDLYKFDPWQLPELALHGEKEWYFFSPRDRKYPNGTRPNRAAGTGYWKATGADKPLGKPRTLAIKKALVFYAGKAPRGVKTNWIMHEYRLANVDRSAGIGNRKNLRLDDWVLCRIYNKKGTIEKHLNVDQKEVQFSDSEEQKPDMDTLMQYSGMLAPESEEQKPNMDTLMQYSGTLTPAALMQQAPKTTLPFDTSELVPKFHTDSSSSGHMLSPELMSDNKEVQSEPKWSEFESSLDFQLNDFNGFQDDPFGSQMQYNEDLSLFQDMFAYMHKPF